MLPTTMAIAFASLLSVQPDGSANDDAAAWSRAHPREMVIFQSWNGDAAVYTPAFRACVDAGLKAGYGSADVVTSCLRQARFAQADEEGRKASERIQAEKEVRHRQYQEKLQKEADQRKAEADERESRAEERRRDYVQHRPEAVKNWMGAVLGYRVALAEDRRDEAKTEIAKEKKYSRVGGVVDKSAIYKSQQEIRWADEDIDERRQTAKDEGVKILGRHDKRVAFVEECFDSAKSDIDRIVSAASSFPVEGQDCLWILLLIKETEPK